MELSAKAKTAKVEILTFLIREHILNPCRRKMRLPCLMDYE